MLTPYQPVLDPAQPLVQVDHTVGLLLLYRMRGPTVGIVRPLWQEHPTYLLAPPGLYEYRWGIVTTCN